jgi:amino acid transporter
VPRTSTTLAVFAFQGVEIVIIAAGEARYAVHDVPRAARRIFIFALVVYILLTLLASLAVPFTDENLQSYQGKDMYNTNTRKASASPFIIAIQNAKLGSGLAGFANGCLYATALTAA